MIAGNVGGGITDMKQRPLSPTKMVYNPQTGEVNYGAFKEKLECIVSQGPVMPLPFLKAAHATSLLIATRHDKEDLSRGGASGLSALDERAQQAILEVVYSATEALQPPGTTVDKTSVPPIVVQQLAKNPSLVNLARSYGYHKQQLMQLPPNSLAASSVKAMLDELSYTLGCVLGVVPMAQG